MNAEKSDLFSDRLATIDCCIIRTSTNLNIACRLDVYRHSCCRFENSRFTVSNKSAAKDRLTIVFYYVSVGFIKSSRPIGLYLIGLHVFLLFAGKINALSLSLSYLRCLCNRPIVQPTRTPANSMI